MKKLITLIVAFGVALLFTSNVFAAGTGAGCCSGHKGVCECKCCDGTPLSVKCMKKECEAVLGKTVQTVDKGVDKTEKKADTIETKAEVKADKDANKIETKADAGADKAADKAEAKTDKAEDKAKKAKEKGKKTKKALGQ